MDYQAFIAPLSKRRQPSAIRSLMPLMAQPGSGKHVPIRGNEHPAVQTLTLDEQEVATGLQYSPTNGLPRLVDWLRNVQTTEHKPPVEFDVCVGNGSQDMFTKAFDMLLTSEDTLLCESPAYVGPSPSCDHWDANLGLQPTELERVLAEWNDPATRPRVLYSVPIGGNPTGCSTTLERKKEIYEIARKYNLLIVEDDPYYYLQFGETRTPSYFSMDVDGRVFRFDSFSKILSAGVRVGCVTGPKPLIERITLHSQASILHASGMSQLMVQKVLEHWGIEGFLEHTDAHLTGLAEWVEPNAGMFVWIKLSGIRDSSSLIKMKAVEKKVLLVPAFEFFPNPKVTPYVRASFSTATHEEIDLALARLADLIRSEQKA
ncbi:pyridoxal phosphate-dependent transferase [Chytriomyces cf. hyalinus JEL632]|nr:pyridoxal phosphate-dependent transferase [Chytriomyces cf. hyalinus JEL632]